MATLLKPYILVFVVAFEPWANSAALTPACAPALVLNNPVLSATLPVQSPGVGFKRDLRPNQGEGPYNSSYLTGELHSSLGRIYVRLDEFKDGKDLSSDFKNQVRSDLAQARADGVKVVLRFAYNYPCERESDHEAAGKFVSHRAVCPQDLNKIPYNPEKKTGDPFNDASFSDASLKTILKHIKELGPILKSNSDVIVGIGGFVGQWGEQHHSTNGLTNDSKSIQSAQVKSRQAQIVKAMLAQFPGPVLMRYPWARQGVFENGTGEHLADADQARVGLENECFLANEGDAGTYLGKSAVEIATEKAYVASVGRKALIGGETCHYNPPRSNCSTAVRELKELHFSYLTDGFPLSIMESWKTKSSESGLSGNGDPQAPCYDYIKSHLGYRFALKALRMDSQIKPGGQLHMRATVQNDGFAGLASSRPAFVILQCDSGWKSGLLPLRGSGTDAQSWAAGQISEIDALIGVPQDAPEGKCSVSLALPDGCDPATRSQDEVEKSRSENCRQNRANPKFSIQLANQEGWNPASGTNLLSAEVLLSKTALPGCEKADLSFSQPSEAAK